VQLRCTDLFRCPSCGSPIVSINKTQTSGLTLDELSCVSCLDRFPVRDGIPRFVPETNYAQSFGFQWNLYRQVQLDSQTGASISRDRLFLVTGWPKDLRGQHILEAGSGAGRFTEILVQTGAAVFSFDYSLAVDANRQNNGRFENLCLFQGDIFHIPLQPKSFDKVLCLGVLQHTPDPERAFFSLTQYIKPNGELVVDVYAKRLTALICWKYLLRPITKRMDKRVLHTIVERTVDLLLPLTGWLRRRLGRVGARLLPIVEYSHLGLPPLMNREWAILDTFDMYSPAHDHPQTASTLRRWFHQAGFEQVSITDGPNGIVGKGRLRVAFGGNS
jgi:SAM-dependent methyltransferase